MITLRLKSTGQKLRSRRIHTHTYIHTDIFQKSCILIPHTSENNYNMFLQQLKKLLPQSFLQEEAKNLYHIQVIGKRQNEVHYTNYVSQQLCLYISVLNRTTATNHLVFAKAIKEDFKILRNLYFMKRNSTNKLLFFLIIVSTSSMQ